MARTARLRGRVMQPVPKVTRVNHCWVEPTACPPGSADARPVDGGRPASRTEALAREGALVSEAVFRQAAALGQRVPVVGSATSLRADGLLGTTRYLRLSRCAASV